MTAISAALRQRCRRPSYLKKVAQAQDLLHLFPNGAYVGWSGFTGVGYPKKIPTALADHVEKNNLQGQLKYNLFVGASSGAETENRWARLNMIERRSPHQVGKEIAKGINNGNINFFDKHLSMFPVDLMYGFYTLNKPNNKLDVTIVEASAITEDGGIIPGASVGASPELIQMADKIIIEVNTAAPSFEGLHDITMTDLPPRRKPYLIMSPEDRIGTPHIPVDPEKVVAIVESDYPDQTQPNAAEDDTSRAIAANLIEFLKHEVNHGRLPQNLLPIQSGIGNIANAVVGGLASGGANFKNLKVWTEVLQDSFLDLFDSGNLDFATATSIRFSPDGFHRFYDRWDDYAPKLLLRSQQVSNSPEIIRRLGVIGMNTPVEVDIYAHANSTCVMGSRMLNGLGGSADFLRSAKYSIMHTPSTRPSKTDPTGVSCIVPMCTHIDQTEHDLDVIVTEQGLADVRGLSPKERARVIIKKCAHPDGYGGNQGYKRYAIGVVAPAVAWATLLMPIEGALIGQFIGFVALYYVDTRAAVRGWTPPWYGVYRFVLTFIVGASIVVSLIGRGELPDHVPDSADRARVFKEGGSSAEKLAKDEEARAEKKKKAARSDDRGSH